ncbi:MAG: hypothetical protein Q8M70_02285, partial [bacterium]|nr:hypothetical protein [bacterium]
IIYLIKAQTSYFSRNMFVNTLFAFIHEYVHYLTRYWIEPYKWLVEGIPMYYTSTYGYDGETITKLHEEENFFHLITFPYIEYTGQNIDFSRDFYDMIDYYIYITNDYDKTKGTHPIQGISFVRYFIKVYGEDTFFLFARNISKSYELTGRTYEELVEDWIQDVKNRFSTK